MRTVGDRVVLTVFSIFLLSPFIPFSPLEDFVYPILCEPGPTPVGHLVLMVGNDTAVVSDGSIYPCKYYDYGPIPS